MARWRATLRGFFNNRWFVLVVAMWMQCCGGTGYLFGSMSPAIKSSLGYNQKEIASLGVALNIGGSVGFLAGILCEILPLWAAILIGAAQNLLGYGCVWLVVTGRAPVPPLWAMCALVFLADNGTTYINTADLVSGVQNFSRSRGPVVGILKGFVGLGGAILTQVYAMMHSPDNASLIFMVAVGPTMVVVALMFFIRPVERHRKCHFWDRMSFTFVQCVCLLLAAYLLGVMLAEDLLDLSQNVIDIFSALLFVILATPIVIPLAFACFPRTEYSAEEETLLAEKQQHGKLQQDSHLSHDHQVVLSEAENENPKDYTLSETLRSADFWLIFWSLFFGSGSGMTVIDNLGQMSQSHGYSNSYVFVSMFSIWSFLGRVGGGYLSETIVSERAYPRPVAVLIAQIAMVFGHLCVAFKFPGEMYIATFLIGLGYGAQWGIVPTAVSEIFGLKRFGTLYNLLTPSNPAGTLIFSGLIASSIYDHEAEKQAQKSNLVGLLAQDEVLECQGSVCFFLTSLIMSGFCVIAATLSLILVHRTKGFYAHLYRKH